MLTTTMKMIFGGGDAAAEAAAHAAIARNLFALAIRE
jgi:hypothetical protein